MRVKMLKVVPLPGEDGVPYSPEVGDILEVADDIGQSLIRGGDAKAVKRATRKVEPEHVETTDEPAPKPKRRRTNKNRGAAPENK